MPTEEEAAVRFHPTLDHSQRGGSSAAARTRSHKAIGHTRTKQFAPSRGGPRAQFLEPPALPPFLQIALQKTQRGNSARALAADVKDETARQQWMAYYLELGEYDAAKEYGWEPPPGWTPPAAGEAPAATSSEGAAAPVVPPLKFGEAEAGQLAITNEGGELAESEIPIFSARWFGQVFAAFTPRGETEEEETKRKEEKAAILVQAFARTLLARIAVKDESRKCAPAPPSPRFRAPPARTAVRDAPSGRPRRARALTTLTALRRRSAPPPSGTVCSLCTRTSRRSTRRRSRRSSASPAAARTRRWPS